MRSDLNAPLLTFGRDASGLSTALRRWHQHPAVAKKFIHILSHQYASQSLKLNLLKNIDLERALVLKRACDLNWVHLFLATCTKTITGDTEEGYGGRRMGEINDEQLQLDSVFDAEGGIVARKVGFSEEELLDQYYFQNVNPDEENYEGHQGNYGGEATQWYRKTVGLPTLTQRFPG